MSHTCPICHAPLATDPRHPRYICDTCAARASSFDGRPLGFSNVDMSGGYEAYYTDTGAPYDSHDCWIDGIACHADEARFGGIVIECRKQPPAANRTTGNDRKESKE